MTNIAARAVAASYHVEAKKDTLRQVQSGDWKATFTLAEVPPALIGARMGQRFILALVEIDDNEEPIQSPAPSDPQGTVEGTGDGSIREAPSPEPKERRRLNELSFAARAGMLIGEELFWRWLCETGTDSRCVSDKATADTEMKHRIGGILSKRDLDRWPEAAQRFVTIIETPYRDYVRNGEYARAAQ